jgi:hypothetical protein
VGRKQRTLKHAGAAQKPSREEAQQAAAAWAEFLYEEYWLEKQNGLNLSKKHVTVEKLTNHDKLNSQLF